MEPSPELEAVQEEYLRLAATLWAGAEPLVPKPANWRIVHRRPRYMLGYTPRVNGYSPGTRSRSSNAPTSSGV